MRSALEELESEAIHTLRECAGQFDRAHILFSGGKDSIVVAHLARLAFRPARPPFALLHIDTGHNFEETLAFRDRFAVENGFELVVRTVQDSIDRGRVHDETGPNRSRNAQQSVTLLDAISELRLDAAIGGARRDEEKARAKERFFSHRDAFGRWEPQNQRPEVWKLLIGRKRHGEQFRVFPLSNWTELDVWEYIRWRNLAVPDLYFADDRQVVRRGRVWMAVTPYIELGPGEVAETKRVRFRTVGDATCTGAVESNASSVDEVIEEVRSARLSERSTRADDQRSDAAMEDRKREGYF
ncbi:sulfate adenylyltransferase subunit CysD [Fimbriimonas ginsengisoli]|uniref:Sulfate adenylyltransferase subunit 2 n=1 Tax=Fimbriimonas ginsengisoli Gsoil 348 TaxID=661478 RepID=A0A068NSG6_FIMGI|nr:sulfate adenylyltransferase subunit CysD [Fimbriimonas ginsengisoli]AIE86483.1 sulfate adenylyltransferase subunit 2 [Fimbriimonas ginsengisoli Gsoil 348]